ncbi:MAG: ArsR/SmtB family transcription factor [Candidatus Limnocylindrales bacterium]
MTTSRATENARRIRAHEPSSPRALVRERGTIDVPLEFEVRTAYDFLISLATCGDTHEYDLLPEDRRWRDETIASLSPERRDDLMRCFGEEQGEIGYGLAVLPGDRPEIRSARDLVTLLATLDTRELVRSIFADLRLDGETSALIERVLGGESAALSELEPRLPEWHRAGMMSLLREPTVWLDRLRGLLTDWLVRYEAIEPRVAHMLERDLELRREDRASLSPGELIERTTGGLRWLPDPRVQRIILAPTYFGRPYNHIVDGPHWRLFVYPLAEGALDRADPLAPPSAMLRLYRALGDESRLRILRLLADKDLYLTEIAQQLELSKPTVKHHLALLRVAGLVTITEEGNLTYYSLRRDRLADAGSELQGFLH